MLDVLNLPEVGAPAVEEVAPTPPPAPRRPDFSRRWRRFAGKDYTALHPFTLEPGETRHVRLDFRLADCDPAGLQDRGYSVVDSLPLTYKVLGFRRTVDVPFAKSAPAVMTMGECNHPFLPRR